MSNKGPYKISIKGIETGFRLTAILLEVIPIFLIVAYIIISKDIVPLFLLPTIMGLLYLLSGWYLFQGESKSSFQIITTILASIYFITWTIPILFQIMSWVIELELVIMGLAIGFLIDIVLLVRYIIKYDEKLEYRFSLKLLSRSLLYKCLAFSYYPYAM